MDQSLDSTGMVSLPTGWGTSRPTPIRTSTTAIARGTQLASTH